MLDFDRSEIEKILNQLENLGFFDVQIRYRFYKENDELCLLGTGASSYVYEMYDALAPSRHYAVKIIGFSDKIYDPEFVKYTVQLQYFLSEQSDYIMRVIDLWTLKVLLDDERTVTRVIGINEDEYDKTQGLELQMVLMEKLEPVIAKDRYGNVSILREDLKSENGVVEFAKQIGRALLCVHDNSFLHRDVKLENIFWDEKSGDYKLGDFGVARYVDDGNAETVLFTDGYGAPEIEKRLQEYYNASADIYSFGITIYLLLNELRFPGSDSYHSIVAQYERDFVVPAPLHASEEMAEIIRKMCSYRSEDRYQSVEEVLMEIGHIDGSYTNEGFKEEFEDIETEVYRDDEEPEEYESIRNSQYEADRGQSDSDDSLLTREERIKNKRALEKEYEKTSIWKCLVSAALFAALFKTFTVSNDYIDSWQFWVLPVLVLIESVLQRIKEFHIGFGIITLGALIYHMIMFGIDVPQVVMMMTLLIGVPSITAGASLGAGFWIFQIITGKPEWFEHICSWDIGWIVIILLVSVVESFVLKRSETMKVSALGERIWIYVVDKIWIIFIFAGIILALLDRFGSIVIPESLHRLHLIRCGIGILVVEMFYLWVYGLLFGVEEVTGVDESLDE